MPARMQPPAAAGFRWDDARVLLALHRERTLARAAASLRVDATTIGRRVDALEESLGARLFDRTPDGAVPSALAEDLISHAEAMERAALALAGGAEGHDRAVEGVVRISVPPGVADFLVAPRLLPGLLAKHPKLRIELDARVGYVDLARREADLVLRGMRPERGDLVATRLVQARSVPFARRALVEQWGAVRDPAELAWVTYGHELAHIDDARWVTSVAAESSIVLRTGFGAQVAAAEAGLGVVLGADELLSHRTDLAKVGFTRAAAAKLPPYPEGALWLASHRTTRSIARVAAVWDWLVEAVAPASRARPRAKPRAKRAST